MENYNEEMDRPSVTNDNDNDNVNVNNNYNDDDNDDLTSSDDNLAIDELLPIVSLKRRSATPDHINNDNDTSNNGTAATTATATAVNSSIAAIAVTTTCTVTARPPQPRSITPNLFLPILVPEEKDEHRDDASASADEEEEEGDWKDTTNNKVEEVRTEGEEGNTDEETQLQTPTPQKQNDSQYPAVRLVPTTKTTTVLPTAVVPALPLPLPILCTPQQHKLNEEATYDDIVCHYNALVQKQRGTPKQRRSSTTPRTPKQQQPHDDYGSLSYSSSSNKGDGDGDKKNNGASTAHSTQPLLLSPYFLFTPDVISSQDEYVIPHDPPALVITNTVPIMNVDVDKDDDDEEERQLCAQLFKIPSISKVLEEAEAVAVDPGYTDHGGTTVGVGSSASFGNNKTTQPSSLRPLRMRRRETIKSGGIFRTSIVGLGGVGSNGTTARPLLRKSSRLTTKTTTTMTINAPL